MPVCRGQEEKKLKKKTGEGQLLKLGEKQETCVVQQVYLLKVESSKQGIQHTQIPYPFLELFSLKSVNCSVFVLIYFPFPISLFQIQPVKWAVHFLTIQPDTSALPSPHSSSPPSWSLFSSSLGGCLLHGCQVGLVFFTSLLLCVGWPRFLVQL